MSTVSARCFRRLGALTLALLLAGCVAEPEPPIRATTSPAAASVQAPREIALTVYDGALGKGWRDWGWAPREIGKGPARVDMSNHGGWIIAHPGLTGRFGALVLRISAPSIHGDFFEVSLASGRRDRFPSIRVRREHRTPLPDGWSQIVLPFRALNPENLPFDRIVLRAADKIGPERVSIDKIGLTAPDPADTPPPVPTHDVALSIDCRGPGTAVSPLIYGIAYAAQQDAKHQHQWTLGATARRWGGNAMSRYNWEHGSALNTGSDWYFENVDHTRKGGVVHAAFLRANREHGVQSALTVPMIGWVAKDTSSYSFPVTLFGPQRAIDPYKKDAGDGHGKDGKPIAPGPPTRTSVASTPDSIRRWVEQIRAEDRKLGTRSVHMYILDNEPMLWNSTHRDVHPEPVTYDELLDRTIKYGSAVRAADPDAVIAGPALWGWSAYFYSALDAAAGVRKKPDRRAHGDVPLLQWYLEKLAEHHAKTGVRILDVVDVHFYPQADRVGSRNGGTDARTAALRLRSTRALWDPSYIDESWISDRVQLIPRMQRLIAESYPGLGFSIGEYNFGAEEHMSGGLAVAEALGRFAQGGVTSAFYWTYPPDRSPAYWAFRAYRNFDGAGGRFLDRSLPTTMADGVSLFASRDGSGSHIVAVVLNLQPDRAIRARVTSTGCAAAARSRAFSYSGGPDGFTSAPVEASGNAITTGVLSPYSMTVLDISTEVKP
jgi:hypothetical protein